MRSTTLDGDDVGGVVRALEVRAEVKRGQDVVGDTESGEPVVNGQGHALVVGDIVTNRGGGSVRCAAG